MNVICCEHPVRHFDRVKGEFVYSPCGKCNSCRKARQVNWLSRLQDESQHWPFVYFFTLTYDNNSLPCLSLSADGSYLLNHQYGKYIPIHDLQCISGWDKDEMDYITDNDLISFPVVRHIQLFLKKVRKRCIKVNQLPCYERKYKSGQKAGQPRYIRGKYEDEQIRYFIVSEQGSSSFRVHYHGLFFFRSKKTAANIEEIVRESWPYGFVNTSRQRKNASQYVAKYVNCVVDLPKVYLHKDLKAFFVCSKFPFIGSLSFNEEKVREIFNTLSNRRSIVNRRNELIDVSNPRTLENQLFPKIQRFSELSHTGRVALYGLAKFSRANSFDEFARWCKRECEMRPYKYAKGKYGLTENIKWITKDLNSINALKRLWYISSQVCLQSVIFGVSLNEYVRKIDAYYKEKDFQKLKDFYSSLEQQPVPPQNLIILDLSVRDMLPSMSYLRRQLLFESYGFKLIDYECVTCIDAFDKMCMSDNNVLVSHNESESAAFSAQQKKHKLKKDYLFKTQDVNGKCLSWHKSKGNIDIVKNYF